MINKRGNFFKGFGIILIVTIFFLFSPTVTVVSDNTSLPTNSSYFPSIPLDDKTTWKYHLIMSGGYPLVAHEFGPFTQDDWIVLGEDQNQTVKILHYFNPPSFPNETIYGFYHQELRFVLWLKELHDAKTGVTSLVQVGETAKDTYIGNITPAENDYKGNIGWFFINGTLYPRTFIKGNMSEGMNWTEYWGPFDSDKEGSVFRERKYIVHEVPITLQNKQYNGFAVNITGPGEEDESVEVTEILYFVEGFGPTGRDIVAKTTQLTPLPPHEGWPSSLPADTIIFDHKAEFVSMNEK